MAQNDIVIHRPAWIGSTEDYLDQLRETELELETTLIQIKHVRMATDIAMHQVATGQTLEMEQEVRKNILKRAPLAIAPPVDQEELACNLIRSILSNRRRRYIGPAEVRDLLREQHNIDWGYARVYSRYQRVKAELTRGR